MKNMIDQPHISLPMGSYLVSGSHFAMAEVVFQRMLSQKTPNTTAMVLDFVQAGDFLSPLQKFFPTVFCIRAGCEDYNSLFSEDGTDSIDRIFRYFEQTNLEEDDRNGMKRCLQALEELSILQGNGRLTKENYLRLHTANAMMSALQTLQIQGRISPFHAEELHATLMQTAKHLIPLENTISAMMYSRNAVQSVTDLPAGSAVILSANPIVTAQNTQLIRQLKTDILCRAKRGEPLLLILHAGLCNPISAMTDLIASLQYQQNVTVFYVSPDIFCTATEGESVERFLNLFDYNLFSRHGGKSAQQVSALFGERIVSMASNAETKDLRLFSATIPDLLLHRNRTVTTTYTPTVRPYVPMEWVLHMETAILYDTRTKEYTFL